MIKYPLILLNMLGVLLANIFSADEITVQHRLPEAIAKGAKQQVEISITKGSLTGFAKLEINVPPGFVATAGVTQGASFTFSNQEATFIWFDMPAENDITVSYYLEATTANEGSFTFKGTFSRIKTNVRVDQPIGERTVKVLPAGEVVSASSQYVSEAIVQAENNTQAQIATTAPVVPAEILLPKATNEIICVRTITKISNTEAQVDLKLINDHVSGFVKVLETLPSNCKAAKINDAGAVVTADENSIKFFWFDVPASQELNLSYKMTCLSSFGNEPAINGKISYIYNNNPVERPIVAAGYTDQVVAQTTEPRTNNNNAPKETTERTQENTTAQTNTSQKEKPAPREEKTPAKETSTAQTQKPATPKTTSVPAPEKGISYKVQILAAHRVVGKSYFLEKHEYGEEFAIENHEGWVKYTTGRFNEYVQARDRREELKRMYSSLPGPFVTAYSEGQRITVQEALLITKQRWYQ